MKILENKLKVGDTVKFNTIGKNNFSPIFSKWTLKEIFIITKIIAILYLNNRQVQIVEVNDVIVNQYLLYNTYFDNCVTITI